MVSRCSSVLEGFYLERLGNMTNVPVLAIPASWFERLRLDSQQAFLLGLLGHGFNYDELVEACPFERIDALRLFSRFLEAGVIDHGGRADG